MSLKNYEELKVWQKAMILVEEIYKATEKFPTKKSYRLVDQMCRASISIASNIAEGSSRSSTKEFVRFINISKGSCAELQTQITISRKLKYLDDNIFKSLINLTSEIGKMLNGLKNGLLKKTKLQTLDSKF